MAVESRAIDFKKVRESFPLINDGKMNGKQLVYFDNAATTQKPGTVIDTISRYYEEENSNTHRGAYQLSANATMKYDRTRQKIAELFNAASSDEIIFTRGTTESINLTAYAWGLRNLKKDDEIIISEMEHHSNIVPWHLISNLTGAKIVRLPVEDDGTIKTERLREVLTNRSRIVAITHISNVLGTINNIPELTDVAHKNNTLVLVDGAQSAGHIKVDLQELGCDFYSASAHKMYGPTGIGFLYINKGVFDQITPFHGGGNMIQKVELEQSTYREIPIMFEAGTMPIAEIIGMEATVDFLDKTGLDEIHNREIELSIYMESALSKIDGITLYGPRDPEVKCAIFSFTLKNIHPHDIATVLDHEGVAIRAGHHCAQPLMKRFNVAATARASLSLYNTEEEIDIFVGALRKAISFFGNRGQAPNSYR